VVSELLDSQKEGALNCLDGALLMPGICTRLWKEQKGQDLLEYALLLLFIALMLVASVKSLSQAIQNEFATITNGVSAATTGGNSGGNGTGGTP
jgi:Flp pilus assembly pilin Flp